MKFNFTPARLVIIKKTRNNKCWQGWRERGTLILLVVLQTGIATVENSMEIPQKIKDNLNKCGMYSLHPLENATVYFIFFIFFFFNL